MSAFFAAPARAASASWYAVQVKTRQEKSAAQQLEYRGYEYFLPLCRSENQKQTGGKAQAPPDALFPGYLFCRLNLSDCRMPVVATPGVIRLVGYGAGPVPVPDEEIAALQTLMNSPLPVEPAEFAQPGTKVRICHGPLRGVEGYVDNIKTQNRLVVRVTLLQRAVSVEVEPWMASKSG
jgi:transcriptional antiterminator RfaH